MSGCSANIEPKANYSDPPLEKYTNVSCYLKEEESNLPYYYVCTYTYDEKISETLVDKEWNVKLDNVYHLFYSEYHYTKEHTIIDNEFYTKGNSNTLILYHYFK